MFNNTLYKKKCLQDLMGYMNWNIKEEILKEWHEGFKSNILMLLVNENWNMFI
jgi:hypothetical protein